LWEKIAKSLLGKDVYISGDVRPEVYYSECKDEGYPCSQEFKEHFQIFMDTNIDEKSFKEKISEGKDTYVFSDDKNTRLKLTTGINKTIYYMIRDKWGNTLYGKEENLLVVPGKWALPPFIISVWLAVLFIIIALSPKINFFHNALMNPYLRNCGSLWLFPLLATLIPPIRKFILIRYTRNIKSDDDFSRWLKDFVIPHEDFIPEKFSKLLINKKRKLFLSGQSGIGKTVYFKYLMGLYASRKLLVPKNIIPVFIPTVRYQGKSFEEMFHAQLSNFGGITDKKLTKRFLEQGPYMIFIDGLNEVDEGTRKEINSVDKYSKVNYFCLSSQEYYHEFSWIDEVKMRTLDKEQVNYLLCQRLGKEKAGMTIEQFTKETYDFYKIPQNLEFAIEMIEDKQFLPKSEYELYDGVLSPILDKWTQDGRSDYSDLINKRSYDMLCAKEQYFNPAQSPFPAGLLNPLAVRKKFLIPREGNYIFRHDLVRSYLASRYFAPRWRELVNDEMIVVDINWDAMLKFTVQSINQSNEIKALLFSLLRKNRDLVGKLFKWLRGSYPDLCQDWSDEFISRFGGEMLK